MSESPRVPAIHGTCDARFEPVRAELARNFAERGEHGAAIAVALDGRLVVDLWAGWMDRERTRAWQRDTLVNVYSVGKGMAALSVQLLVERGLLDVDAPVARAWPEFAAAGKSAITLRELLAHRAGLPAVRTPLPPLAMYDWKHMTSALAAETPWWTPGERHGYHVNTFGYLLGEPIQRATGRSFAEFFRSEIARPLDADFHFGLASEHDTRIADTLTHEGPIHFTDADPERELLLNRTYANPQGISGNGTVNTRAWRAAVIPSTNGHANARAIARIYAMLACDGRSGGVTLLRSDTIDLFRSEAADGADCVLPVRTRFGLGYQLTFPERSFGPNPRSFGHFGAGGSLGFADPDARLAFGYTINLPGPRWNNPRTRAMIDAVYASL